MPGPNVGTVTYGDVEHLHSATALYPRDDHERAGVILRSGATEEGLEVVYGTKTPVQAASGLYVYPDTVLPRVEATGELGDALWYVPGIRWLAGVAVDEVMNPTSRLDDLQRDPPDMLLPMITPDDDRLSVRPTGKEAAGVFLIALLRMIDRVNHKMPGLWRGFDELPDPALVLRDYIFALAHFATAADLSLAEGVVDTYNKLMTRERKPAVIWESVHTDSMRNRLMPDKWIDRMVPEVGLLYMDWRRVRTVPPAYKDPSLEGEGS